MNLRLLITFVVVTLVLSQQHSAMKVIDNTQLRNMQKNPSKLEFDLRASVDAIQPQG